MARLTTTTITCDGCQKNIGDPAELQQGNEHVFFAFEHHAPGEPTFPGQMGGEYCSLECLVEHIHTELRARVAQHRTDVAKIKAEDAAFALQTHDALIAAAAARRTTP